MAHCGQKVQCGERDPETGNRVFECKCRKEIMSLAQQESMEEEWWE